MKKNILILALTISAISLAACGKKDNVVETQPSLEVIAPTETEPQETLSDKLEETKTLVIPTIGTKEVEKEVEVTDEAGETTVETVTETVGVVETLAPEVEVSTESPEESQVVEDLRPDVIVDDSNNVGIEAGHIEVSEELSEDQLISMDSIIEYWQTEPRLGEDYLDYVLSNSGLSSLSDESKAHIKETLMKYYPHTDTVPYEQIQNELYN